MTTTSIAPRRDEGALGPYFRAIRAHRVLVAVIMLAAIGASAAWLSLRHRQYEASAQVLVTPIPDADPSVVGLHLLRDSSDPTRNVQTAASLLDTPDAARLAASRLGRGWTTGRVLHDTSVVPEGQSNILAVTADAKNPRVAAAVANQFAAAAIQVRGQVVQRQVAQAIAQLRTRQASVAGNATAASTLQTEIGSLQALRGSGDPTLSLSRVATAPGSPSGAPAWLVVLVTLLAGFALASATALLIELVDRRVRNEEEAVERYPLPVLARVPALPRALRRAEIVSPLSMPPNVREAFRTLQIQLDRHGTGRTVMVTSASTGDGKTTAAVNLAFALGRAGHRVILLDLDLRKRDISRHLSVEGAPGLVAMLSGERQLSELLVPAPELPSLGVVPAGAGNMVLFEALARKLPIILAQARQLADFVVLDTAPLGEVSDALAMTHDVDDIVLAVRPGNTDRLSFDRTVELLERNGATPAGLLVVGQAVLTASSYRPYETGLEDEVHINGNGHGAAVSGPVRHG